MYPTKEDEPTPFGWAGRIVSCLTLALIFTSWTAPKDEPEREEIGPTLELVVATEKFDTHENIMVRVYLVNKSSKPLALLKPESRTKDIRIDFKKNANLLKYTPSICYLWVTHTDGTKLRKTDCHVMQRVYQEDPQWKFKGNDVIGIGIGGGSGPTLGTKASHYISLKPQGRILLVGETRLPKWNNFAKPGNYLVRVVLMAKRPAIDSHAQHRMSPKARAYYEATSFLGLKDQHMVQVVPTSKAALEKIPTIHKVKLGMTKKEAETILGQPYLETWGQTNIESWIYKDHLIARYVVCRSHLAPSPYPWAQINPMTINIKYSAYEKIVVEISSLVYFTHRTR